MSLDRALFSPDGTWLLCGTVLVDVATGWSSTLPIQATSTAWWPARSASSIMLIRYEVGSPQALAAFDLASGATEELGLLSMPNPGYGSIHELALSADGRFALCGTETDPPEGFAWGSGIRVSCLDVEKRKIEMLDTSYKRVGGHADRP